MQLNPFEIKAEILNIIEDCQDETNPLILTKRVHNLDESADRAIIEKILFKELLNAKASKEKIIRFLLQRYVPKESLITQLWAILKNSLTSSEVKIIVLSYLRELESDWHYEDFESALGNDIDIVDEDTKNLLNKAVVNPEVQIDFLDFLNSVNDSDKLTLIQSLAEDYSEDALANILVPVFLSAPETTLGKATIDILGQSHSQLAYHALNTAYEYAGESIKPLIKKNLNILKLSGIREDNSIEFYKNMLSDSKPYRSCVTYPDGMGNQALIFSRVNKNKRVQFVAVVLNDYTGIRDCFGFNDISEFECDKIIERFYKDEPHTPVPPTTLKTLLLYGENISKTNTSNWLLPYEYVCWKNLLSDVEAENYEIETVLDSKLNSVMPTISDVHKVFSMDFMRHWFLHSNYSSEIEAFLEIANSEVLTTDFDFDLLIREYVHKVFYDEEYCTWRKRLLLCAYIKSSEKDTQTAEILYGIYKNQNLFEELLVNILRKSVYEYYFSLKYNTEENQNKFTLKQLDDIITFIENKWVHNA